MVKKQVKENIYFLTEFMDITHSNITAINSSKLFAGMMIIILNIASKFVTFKFSKTIESYLKYTFSYQVLVFAIAWMGTRDIYTSIFITLVFLFITEVLFNEESGYCILPKEFCDYHITLLENNSPDKITEVEIQKAKNLLERAKKQNIYQEELTDFSF